jgi:Kef-type K+ transport system membrane component KefB
MFEVIDVPGQVMFLLGATIVAAIFTKALFTKIRLPAIVGFLAIGLVIRGAHEQWGLLRDPADNMFLVLSNIGIACLLFRVGLESNLKGLMDQLSRASLIWIGDFSISGLLGFVTAYWVLELGLPTSLIVATALTATSVGVSVAVWQSENALNSPKGQLMVDVAELDDVSGVLLMGVLFAVLPLLHDGQTENLGPVLAKTLGVFLMHLLAFLAFCFLFSHFIEERLTRFYAGLGPRYFLMILVVGTAFVIAGFAAALGFSIAIGAFFAGLMFSRDPQAVKVDGAFSSLYEFFSPFFFIQIGLSVEIESLWPALGLGLVLLVPAVLGKLFGNGIPSLFVDGWPAALLVGTSLIPRAEIAMVIVQHGLELGPWAMSSRVFAAMVFVSLSTCILSPVVVTLLLRQWPQREAT